MSLETYGEPDELYLARGSDVGPRRPLFTGDVYSDVPIPGVQERGMAVVIAHPCSIRGARGMLLDRILVAAVEAHAPVGPAAWTGGYYDFAPFPELVDGRFYVGRFDGIGRALSEDLPSSRRLACLSVYGVNLLQQRLIWHLTRLEVETFRLNEASAHVYEEVDLLEEWNDAVCAAGVAETESTALFDEFLRRARGDSRSYQGDLRDPQRRSAIRAACRAESRRIVAGRIECQIDYSVQDRSGDQA